MTLKPIIPIICGPTASGKSGLALKFAQAIRGEIVNADAIQLFKDLKILTAFPSEEELKAVPHHLYGLLGPQENSTVMDYLGLLKPILQDILHRGKIPILCGGTGFYMMGILEGLSPIPQVSAEHHQEALNHLTEKGIEAFFQEIQQIDPKLTQSVHPNDHYRLLRGYEVYLSTGKPLSHWQKSPKQLVFPDYRFWPILLDPPRSWLYDRINQRTRLMFDQGLLKEVAEFLGTHQVSKSDPIYKVIGLDLIEQHLKGAISQETCVSLIRQATRNYAKRQSTWFRNQLQKRHSAENTMPLLNITDIDLPDLISILTDHYTIFSKA